MQCPNQINEKKNLMALCHYGSWQLLNMHLKLQKLVHLVGLLSVCVIFSEIGSGRGETHVTHVGVGGPRSDFPRVLDLS